MKTRPFEESYPAGAIWVEPDAEGSRSLTSLDRDLVLGLFERHGALIFRGFDATVDNVMQFTDLFSQDYRRPDPRSQERDARPTRGGNGAINTVTLGSHALPLHSEAGHGLVWPELIWFLCNAPTSAAAYTTIGDGIAIWRGLSPTTRQRFLAQPVKFQIHLPLAKQATTRIEPWPFERPGVSGIIDGAQGIAILDLLRYAVNETRTGQLAFVNYLLLRRDGEIRALSMADGKPLDEDLFAELDEVAEKMTREVHSEKGDLMMLDNRRYMHGRRGITAGDTRDILQIQTIRSSFGYGATTRKRAAG